MVPPPSSYFMCIQRQSVKGLCGMADTPYWPFSPHLSDVSPVQKDLLGRQIPTVDILSTSMWWGRCTIIKRRTTNAPCGQIIPEPWPLLPQFSASAWKLRISRRLTAGAIYGLPVCPLGIRQRESYISRSTKPPWPVNPRTDRAAVGTTVWLRIPPISLEIFPWSWYHIPCVIPKIYHRGTPTSITPSVEENWPQGR